MTPGPPTCARASRARGRRRGSTLWRPASRAAACRRFRWFSQLTESLIRRHSSRRSRQRSYSRRRSPAARGHLRGCASSNSERRASTAASSENARPSPRDSALRTQSHPWQPRRQSQARKPGSNRVIPPHRPCAHRERPPPGSPTGYLASAVVESCASVGCRSTRSRPRRWSWRAFGIGRWRPCRRSGVGGRRAHICATAARSALARRGTHAHGHGTRGTYFSVDSGCVSRWHATHTRIRQRTCGSTWCNARASATGGATREARTQNGTHTNARASSVGVSKGRERSSVWIRE